MANDDLWPAKPTNPNVGPAVYRRGAGKMRNRMAGQILAPAPPAAGAGGTGTGIWHPCCCGISNSCCSGLPTVMHGTWTATGCACVDGAVTTFTVSGTTQWNGSGATTTLNFDACDQITSTYSFVVRCSAGSWFLDIFEVHSGSGAQTGCALVPLGTTTVNATSAQCSPLQLVFNGTIQTASGFAACPCAGTAWTLTVTV